MGASHPRLIMNMRDADAISDEYRIGTTLESVTPIPEPASLALLGLGGLLMLRLSRRA